MNLPVNLPAPQETRYLALEHAPEALRLLPEIFDVRTGYFQLKPAAWWKALDPELVTFIGHAAARWCIVTTELVEWLRDRIAGRKAIEIGAGYGDLGFHLGIPQTDSYAHVTDPAAIQKAALFQHPLTRPPKDVRKLDGLAAVHACRPEVVVAAWVTHQGINGDGYYLGVRETALVREADYILIGNEAVHHRKPILALPHETHAPPWIVSRALHPALDRIWVWKKQKRRAR